MDLLIFILVCYGLTTILVWGKVFSAIRPSYEFFHCSQCVGFWVGVFVNLFFPVVKIAGFFFVSSLFAGALASGTSYILDKVFGDDGININ